MNEPNLLESRIFGISRPDPNLLIYYCLVSCAALILFPVAFTPYLIKYLTLRYRFDAEGVSMKWGFFFRREINLTYKRIQDIHISRDILDRWLGLATLSIQTASGAAGAEMAIVGLKEHRDLRDFLYSRMRGHEIARNDDHVSDSSSEALELLRAIHADLAAIRAARTREETNNDV